MVQPGKADEVSWRPFVQEEFTADKEHYDKLGQSDRIQMDSHSGGHEIRYGSGLAFLKKWMSCLRQLFVFEKHHRKHFHRFSVNG